MYTVDKAHLALMAQTTPSLKFSDDCDYAAWREQVKERLVTQLGKNPDPVDPEPRVEFERDMGEFIEKRVIFKVEKDLEAPIHIWIPKGQKTSLPALICLQGHSSGMHISMDRAVHPGDEKLIAEKGDRNFAVQIVEQGYIAVCLEQRGFGERYSPAVLKFTPNATTTCWHPAMTAMLLGRTLIGERVWDISRTIDVLERMPEVDPSRIGVMGNSGGGTATYYAACLDERISIAMPSCAVCTFKDSIVAGRHCMCNYIPNLATYVDMGDLACLIAPRKLVMVSGEHDTGFHIEGARESYDTIERIYKKAGAEDNCRFVVGPLGHRFYADLSWPVFNELSGWKR